MRGSIPYFLAATIGLVSLPATASQLIPHQAVYDLSLASQTEELVSVDGRIAMQLKMEECGVYDLDYRFVARFQQEGETTLTDQRTLAREGSSGSHYEFDTTTFVDGAEQNRVKGAARNEPGATTVEIDVPLARTFSLPASVFPLNHTSRLIERAKAGERIVETRLFDGDDQAEKLLTTTAIIVPADGKAQAAADAAVEAKVEGMRAWRIDESYFNSDSNADGLPIFQTRYTLYENGVTDDLFLDFGDYALTGRLSRLDYYDAPAACG